MACVCECHKDGPGAIHCANCYDNHKENMSQEQYPWIYRQPVVFVRYGFFRIKIELMDIEWTEERFSTRYLWRWSSHPDFVQFAIEDMTKQMQQHKELEMREYLHQDEAEI